MILPKDRDPRFITIHRGGTLTDIDHRLLALWAATCAEHVLPLFEAERPADPRPRRAIAEARAWVRGEILMSQSRAAGGHANAAARLLCGPARHAAYAVRAARAAAPRDAGGDSGRLECCWQRAQLPNAIRALVLDDQRLRTTICWSAFDC